MFWRPAGLALIVTLGASAQAAAQAPVPFAPPAPAAPVVAAKPNPDLRCIIVANALGAQSKDPRQQQEAQMMLVFFLGKAERGTPGLNLGPALAAQDGLLHAARPTPAQAQAQVNTCVTNFESRMKALQALMRPPTGAAPATTPAGPVLPAPK